MVDHVNLGDELISHFNVWYCCFYHTIENKANHNTGTMFFPKVQYYTQPSHGVLSICCIDCVGHCFLVWHGCKNS